MSFKEGTVHFTKTACRKTQTVFSVVFAILSLCAVGKGVAKTGVLMPIFLLFTVGSVFLLYFACKKLCKTLSPSQVHFAFALTSFCFLALLIFCAQALKSEPIRDLLFVDTASRSYAETLSPTSLYDNQPDRAGYFARYPNNQALMLVLTALHRTDLVLFGHFSDVLPIALNVTAIFASVLLAYATTVKLSFSKEISLFCGILCMLFAPFYAYATVYYTDTLSMPFVTLAVFLFTSKPRKKALRVLTYALCGGVVALGMVIKGSVVVLLPTLIIVSLCNAFCRQRRVSAVVVCVAVIVGFTATALPMNAILPQLSGVTSEESDREKFPFTHWIMMGLDGCGGYSEEDVEFTASHPSLLAKKEASKHVIGERISRMGVGGLACHFGIKIFRTWCDGTYFITNGYLENGEPSLLRTFVNSKAFSAYSTAFQAILLALTAVSFKAKRSRTLVVRVALCGIMLFLMIWETRSRYLLNFTPILLIAGADGAQFLLTLSRHPRKPSAYTTTDTTTTATQAVTQARSQSL